MHEIFENLIPNLVSLWKGEFKELDISDSPFVLLPAVWERLGAACVDSGATIPSAFGARVPNIATEAYLFTAEMWCFFALHLAPILLRRKFQDQRYYRHYMELVKIINVCLQFEITDDDITKVREGVVKWVSDYERLYVEYLPERASACPLTIHALLHIPDALEMIGPVWTVWEFPTERFCGILLPAVKSRRFPYASLSSYAADIAQLSQIELKYDLHEQLSLKPESRTTSDEYSYQCDAYPKCMLLGPRRTEDVNKSLHSKIAQCLATRFNVTMATARRHVPKRLQQWGRILRLEGGDLIRAADLISESQNSRDASWIRYQLLVDKNAHIKRAAPEFFAQNFYGQLRTTFVLEIPASEELGTDTTSTLLLAAIYTAEIELTSDSYKLPFYKKMGRLEVVDIASVQCVVGRVYDAARGWWGIIDRSGPYAHAQFVSDGEDMVEDE
ncbi:hypothetical protein OH76DRAFT_1458261 [Lentinus brumalis]|uniref:Uncharacterized protein n=1 Tax=Lentinus brumalis TaxID=2498619 RepID=A0A371CU59_9APHY|nr:hypothetical protein OH76DRAFT_1458261 [Polyporus brumalis]